MSHDSTLATTKPTARKALAHMVKPEGMTPTTWRGVRATLGVIVEHYPKAYPSQARIAAIIGASERSVCRWIAAAQAAGLLHVVANVGAKPKRQMGHYTNRYWLTKDDRMARELNSYGVQDETSSQNTSCSVPKSARPAASRRTEGNVIYVAKWWHPDDEDRGRQVGPPEPSQFVGSKKKKKRPTADEDADSASKKGYIKKRKPAPVPEWKRMADYFETNWELMKLNTGQYKGVRGADSYNQCRTYIEAHFENMTEMQVHKLMEEFIRSVAMGHVTLKPGQSGWRCFTGAWGRQPEAQQQPEDIYAEMRKRLAEGKGG